MAGKTVPLTLRKPPNPTDVAARDAFVAAGADKPAPRKRATNSDTPKAKGVVKRADGSEARRLVVYLPPEIMQRLRMHCAEHEVNLSTAASEAFAQWLGA